MRRREFLAGASAAALTCLLPVPAPTSHVKDGVLFDGTVDYLSRGAGLADGRAFTISFWVRYRGKKLNPEILTRTVHVAADPDQSGWTHVMAS